MAEYNRLVQTSSHLTEYPQSLEHCFSFWTIQPLKTPCRKGRRREVLYVKELWALVNLQWAYQTLALPITISYCLWTSRPLEWPSEFAFWTSLLNWLSYYRLGHRLHHHRYRNPDLQNRHSDHHHSETRYVYRFLQVPKPLLSQPLHRCLKGQPSSVSTEVENRLNNKQFTSTTRCLTTTVPSAYIKLWYHARRSNFKTSVNFSIRFQ